MTTTKKPAQRARAIRTNQERIAGGPMRALTINVTELVHAARDVVTLHYRLQRKSQPEIAELERTVERFKHLD